MRGPVRLLVIAALLCALAAGASPAFAADLVVQSVNTSEFPAVELRVALPPEMVVDGAVPRFELSENGVDRVITSADPESSFVRQSIDVVLLLDASGSMAGKPLAAAQAAAREFVASLGPSDRIAVVAIGETPKVITSFTADRTALDRAIASVEAKGETALYDSLVRAASLIDQSAAQQRYVVLLSDGGDTVSSASLDKAVSRVKSAGAPVYAVALSSPEYNPRAVKALARGTRGTLLSTRESDKLTDIFKAIAEEIQTTWLVAYRSADPAAPDLEITLKRDERRAAGEGHRDNGQPFVRGREGPAVESGQAQPAVRDLWLGDSHTRRSRRRLCRRGNRVAAQARGHGHRPTPVLRPASRDPDGPAGPARRGRRSPGNPVAARGCGRASCRQARLHGRLQDTTRASRLPAAPE